MTAGQPGFLDRYYPAADRDDSALADAFGKIANTGGHSIPPLVANECRAEGFPQTDFADGGQK